MLAPSFVSAGAASKSTRTFSDFETVADAMNGICQLYEQRLKQMNPGEHPQLRPTVPMSAAPPPSAYRAPLCALRHLLRRSVQRAACCLPRAARGRAADAGKVRCRADARRGLAPQECGISPTTSRSCMGSSTRQHILKSNLYSGFVEQTTQGADI